jgi:hypothetical protein
MLWLEVKNSHGIQIRIKLPSCFWLWQNSINNTDLKNEQYSHIKSEKKHKTVVKQFKMTPGVFQGMTIYNRTNYSQSWRTNFRVIALSVIYVTKTVTCNICRQLRPWSIVTTKCNSSLQCFITFSSYTASYFKSWKSPEKIVFLSNMNFYIKYLDTLLIIPSIVRYGRNHYGRHVGNVTGGIKDTKLEWFLTGLWWTEQWIVYRKKQQGNQMQLKNKLTNRLKRQTMQNNAITSGE